MAQVGEVKLDWNEAHTRKRRYIYSKCPSCGLERWLMYGRCTVPTRNCKSCSAKLMWRVGSRHTQWNGGRQYDKHSGYVKIWVDSNNPYFDMAVKTSDTTGHILEHRLVMAEHIGRCLKVNEHVHHRNNIKRDNRIENLQLLSPNDHIIHTQICSSCDLKLKVKLLEWRVKELESKLREVTNESSTITNY